MQALESVGVTLLVLSGLAVVWAGLTDQVAKRRLAAMSDLLLAGEHARVLDHAQPPRPYRPVGNQLRATSAVLTGQYARALHLLDEAGVPGRLRSTLAASDVNLRGAALIGLGRYLEATAVLGDEPTTALARHQRAQVAVETGDDAVALRLLAVPDREPDDDAGRRRILGELHIRRLRLDEGEALVREAQRLYRASTMAGREVDEAYCELHLGQAALSRGDREQAVRRIGAAREMLSVRPDNAPGIALVDLYLAEAHALAGDEAAADAALAAARVHAHAVASPALDAAFERATGMVGVHLSRPDAASHLRAARAMHQALGERPHVEYIDTVIERLEGPT
ncbi:hypothetical protein [Pedococcus bigeumensis]|uniref:Tetratricopeptide repeat protein n=1 Tax=Pedococcus bigeumensis TaxID=433644 RepID=A0A502D3H3_9MICO|nr:hypothetical protein [Pedococcus bigeumensis]TPG19748.1 hypothetical protein EAH86_04785 [Pedococcus bigeumensis]